MSANFQPPKRGEFRPGTEPLPLILPSNKEILDSYGPEAVLQWLRAETYQDMRALLKAFWSGKTTVPPKTATPASMTDDEREKALRTLLLSMTFWMRPEKKEELEASKQKYEAEIFSNGILIAKSDRRAAQLTDDVARRTVQIAIIDCLFHGELTVDGLKTKIKENPAVAIYEDWDIEYEYADYVDVLMKREQIYVDPPAQ